MAIAFVSKASTVNSSSTTTTVVTTPGSLAVGQRLYAIVGCIGTGNNVTGPAGWTKLAEFAPETNFKTAAYYRDVTGTEAGTYTWTWSVGGRNFGHMESLSGVDLTKVPAATVAAGTPDATGPHTSPSVTVEDQGWLITAVASRQSPGVNGAVGWTSNDGSDSERYDVTATNTGGSAQLPSALYDSNRALAGAAGGGVSGLPDGARPLNKYNALVAGSGSMRIGATMKKDELDGWQSRLAGVDWMRIFPNSNGQPPDWSDSRYAFCQTLGADPFISSKIDGSTTGLDTLMAWLQTMPSWIKDDPARTLWLTDRHEPEGDVAAATYITNIKALITRVNALPAPYRNKIKVGPVLTRQYTENTAGRTYETYDPGPVTGCDFFGVDMYVNSWQSLPDPTAFLSKVKAYRYNNTTDTRLRVFPELGAIGFPSDTDGSARATWMQGVHDQLVTWSQAVNGWPFGGYIYWNTEGKSGSVVAGIGTRRWFQFDRHHNSQPYTYYDSSAKKNVTDPEGGYDFLPVVAGSGTSGSGGGTSSASRTFTAATATNSTHVWAIPVAASGGVTVGGNPWRDCGYPLK